MISTYYLLLILGFYALTVALVHVFEKLKDRL